MSVPRGLRLNNPGNVRHGDPWYGLAQTQLDPDFCAFTHPKFGIRAMAKILFRYRDLGVRTIRKIIDRWAPPSENDTDAYVRDVARRCSVDPDDTIDVTDYKVLRPLVESIIWHENGQQPYDDMTIRAGLELAGARNLPLWPISPLPRPKVEPEPEVEKPSLWGWVKGLFGG